MQCSVDSWTEALLLAKHKKAIIWQLSSNCNPDWIHVAGSITFRHVSVEIVCLLSETDIPILGLHLQK
jgi:hypothetical protein